MFFHIVDNDEIQKWSEGIGKIYNYFKDKDWLDFTLEDLKKHREFLIETKPCGISPKSPDLRLNRRTDPIEKFKIQTESFEFRRGKVQSPLENFFGGISLPQGNRNSAFFLQLMHRCMHTIRE